MSYSFHLGQKDGPVNLQPVLERLTNQLSLSRQPLSPQEVEQAVECLLDEHLAPEVKANFLGALATRGETIEEIAAFTRSLRGRSIQPALDGDLRSTMILDVVGTGGDRLSTFNISTTVAILAAAAGVRVAKHGNRGSTSPIGSTDVMEALGIPFDQAPEEAVNALRKHHFAYFFARRYHPAFRHVTAARKLCAARGQATIFNFLGPLLNPAMPSAMLVGVSRPALCEPLARVLQSLGVRRAMVVCGEVPGDGAEPVRYLDEVSPLGSTSLAEYYQERGFSVSRLELDGFPLQRSSLGDLKGGDAGANAEIIKQILGGKERGPKRDAVLVNAAAALFVANRVPNLVAGWELAAQTIDSGVAVDKLRELTSRPGAS